MKQQNKQQAPPIRQRKVFTTLKLADGRTATIHEATGWDIFRASLLSGGDSGKIPTYFLMEITAIDGKFMESAEELENILAGDYLAIMEVIGVLMQPTNKYNP